MLKMYKCLVLHHCRNHLSQQLPDMNTLGPWTELWNESCQSLKWNIETYCSWSWLFKILEKGCVWWCTCFCVVDRPTVEGLASLTGSLDTPMAPGASGATWLTCPTYSLETSTLGAWRWGTQKRSWPAQGQGVSTTCILSGIRKHHTGGPMWLLS